MSHRVVLIYGQPLDFLADGGLIAEVVAAPSMR
jgi:hypothetical protein